MANSSKAQDLSRTLQARDESRDQVDPNACLSTLEPLSGGSTFELKEGEGDLGSQDKHQTNRQTQTLQEGSPNDIEKADAPQFAAKGSSAQESDNSGPKSGHGNPISHQLPSKGIRDPITAIEALPELSKEQLNILRDIFSLIEVTSTSKVEFIWYSVLQLAGLIFVVVFGVFAALAYDAANVANKQSSQANQLALLNFCMAQNTESDTCIGVAQNSFDSLNTLATAILGPGVILTTSTLSPSSTPPPPLSDFPSNTTTSASTTAVQTSFSTEIGGNAPSSGHNSFQHLSTPALVGTIVGVILSIASISISGCAFYIRFSQKRKKSSLSDDSILEGY